MGDIIYAQVIFEDEKRKKLIWLVSDIKYSRKDGDGKSIQPKDDQDFDRKHKYYAKYFLCTDEGKICDTNHSHIHTYYGVFITLLGSK